MQDRCLISRRFERRQTAVEMFWINGSESSCSCSSIHEGYALTLSLAGANIFSCCFGRQKNQKCLQREKGGAVVSVCPGGFSRTLCQTKNVQGQDCWREGRRAAVQQPRRPLSGAGCFLFKTGKGAFCMKNVKGRGPCLFSSSNQEGSLRSGGRQEIGTDAEGKKAKSRGLLGLPCSPAGKAAGRLSENGKERRGQGRLFLWGLAKGRRRTEPGTVSRI